MLFVPNPTSNFVKLRSGNTCIEPGSSHINRQGTGVISVLGPFQNLSRKGSTYTDNKVRNTTFYQYWLFLNQRHNGIPDEESFCGDNTTS